MAGLWDGPVWGMANALEIAHFRSESSGHRPRTRVKLLYDREGVHGIFHVRDRYVRCVRTEFQSLVCCDSCVEFFVQPKPDKGYFSFEFNCGGALLSYYITDPTRTADGFRKFVKLTVEDGQQIRIFHSLPPVVEPEIQEETEWVLEFFVPFALLEKYTGPLGVVAAQQWRANFFKCADETSHPHWASWSPLDELNFHLPRCFGTIVFES